MGWNLWLATLVAAVVLVGPTGCDGPGEAHHSDVSVRTDTTAGGWVHVRHDALPDRVAWRLVEDLRLGSAAADDTAAAFGDVRGVASWAGDGIAVLDHQADEIRLFGPDGAYLGVLAGPGEGPGELGSTNGLVTAPDGGMWVNDHGNRRLTRFHPDEPVRTMRRFVGSYGYLWDGGVGPDGRVWDFTFQFPEPYDPTPGVKQGRIVHWAKVADPSSGAVDSLEVVVETTRGIALPRGSIAIPFGSSVHRALDPVGGSIWVGHSDAFRFTRISLEGDTLAVLEAAVAPEPVREDERTEAIDRAEAFMERAGRVEVDWDALIPAAKPLFDQLVVDGSGRLWVRRAESGRRVYHVFEARGAYVGRVEAPSGIHGEFRPVIRQDTWLGLVTDELDVPYVLRAALEAPGGG